MTTNSTTSPRRPTGVKLRGADKLARIPIKIAPTQSDQYLRKPEWLRIPLGQAADVKRLRRVLRENRLHTVCEEANCPNLGECFSSGTATFMIMGDICTRRCPFCDVGHGRPNPLDAEEPENLASTIAAMKLRYAVITSVDRDDLRDGGAAHFVQCIEAARRMNPGIRIEILTPDFRGRAQVALDTLAAAPPDVFNHNLETVPRLYRQARPGADYAHSLSLLRDFKSRHPDVTTKSGLMLGLGEGVDEVEAVMRDMREHDVDVLTLGQYLQPSPHHLPVRRYVTPNEFEQFRELGLSLGFTHVASGALVHSSYHAEEHLADR
ncbi:lipoyl synthase [Burkholderia sp. Ac-20353]|uniref:lipoyl synthase n=1 Tax=Burkholderia sp. Ac-20353 TaxID=2703894 RepID=UPI00197CB39C|nr:lipoyl synthase [Burkholderia sp. Ac-20353]MBN3786428.1 lipoyl synthase [Burkholderia sp. Ac-20353]